MGMANTKAYCSAKLESHLDDKKFPISRKGKQYSSKHDT